MRLLGTAHGFAVRFFLCVLSITVMSWAQGADTSQLPRIVKQEGRHAFLVDGAPFWMLCAQVNNSSAWPAALPQVWPAMRALHVNTVQVPIAWEQIEPREGHFDFSFLDTLLAEARAENVRLVLLWFATWKNNGPSYAPEWVKLDNRRFPRVITAKGEVRNSLSPHFEETLAADRKAFIQLMRHLKQADPQHTVIMVQVQNEPGTYGAVRDHSPTAQKLFEAAVPARLVNALGKRPGTWREVFGKDADEYFHAWHVARYIDEVAAAGKREYALPLYVNAALRDPFNYQDPYTYSSGGPTWNVLDVWAAAIEAIDLIAPDIYMREYPNYVRTLEQYSRPDNPLFVAETGNNPENARFFFETFGRRGIGFAPFGMDYTGYVNYPLGAERVDAHTIEAFARNYRLVKPMMRELAELASKGKLWGVAEPTDVHEQRIALGEWQAVVSYGRAQFGMDPPKGNPTPAGGVLIAELGANEYLVTGFQARVSFERTKSDSAPFMLARVEEGRYENGKWVFLRVWNGDQTDYGLNFTSREQVLKVKLAQY